MDPDQFGGDDGPVAGSAVAEAIQRLMARERGRQALLEFRVMLQNGAVSMEPEEWAGLETLCRACADGAAPAIQLHLPRL